MKNAQFYIKSKQSETKLSKINVSPFHRQSKIPNSNIPEIEILQKIFPQIVPIVILHSVT